MESGGRSLTPEEAASRGVRDARFVQQPGRDNALGSVKFGLRASQGVYLHDTNDRNGFDEDQRALSHGCMRVGRAMDLAAWALRIDGGEARRRVDADDRREHVPDEPIRVLTTYFTAWPDGEGKVAYYEDVYGRDGGGRCGAIPARSVAAPRGRDDGNGGAAYTVAPDYEVSE